MEIMDVDDTLFKRVIGELMVLAARSDVMELEIEQFLASKDTADLIHFRTSSEQSRGEPRICAEPSEELIELLENLRRTFVLQGS
jgi:hypothetical protein